MTMLLTHPRVYRALLVLLVLGLFMAKCGHDNFDDFMNN